MPLPTNKSVKTTEFTKLNTLLYGPPKIGKTTFASQVKCPGQGKVLFLATEAGHSQVEVFKVDIKSWVDVQNVGRELTAPGHGFGYLVIDIVDWFYKHCEKYICDQYKVKHHTDLAYGKGSALVKDEFVRVVNRFNALGLGICFLSHSADREQKTRTESWTISDTTLQRSPSAVIAGLCDFIFYAYLDTKTKQRVIRTKGTKYINAGDRTGLLPEVMPFEFDAVYEVLTKRKDGSNGSK